jgi:hypothetical protein
MPDLALGGFSGRRLTLADRPHKRYAFMFESADGEDPAIEADTLTEARAADPSLVDARLESVWCLTTVNRVWAVEYDKPWEDADA